MEMHTDPVCGMRLSSDEVKARTEFDGKTYHFCSMGCKEQFQSHPEKYASRAELSHEEETMHGARR